MALPTLETPRLRLRPFEIWDASEVQRLAGDFRIADTTLRIPHPYEDGMAEAWIESQAEMSPQSSEIVFAIIRKEDASLVGAVGLANISHPPLKKGGQGGFNLGRDTMKSEAELGYWIGVPYWNQGYASEAGAAILDFAFSELGLKRVHANHFRRNPASGRVLQKLGMKSDPSAPTQVEKAGKVEVVVAYEISAGR
ncbi:MAG TPA: GNAT family N-acetyltransferase [bacterium]|nr:GNAT family N-acetyltransferase [bacterium]